MTIDFTPAELRADALKEIGNIGAGHAATALSQLLNAKISLAEPRVDVVKFCDLADRIRYHDRSVAAMHMAVRGDAAGHILVLFDSEQAMEFVRRFIRRVIGDIRIYDSIADSTLKELSNIIAGSYLSAIAHLASTRLEPSVPTLSFGSVRSAFEGLMTTVPDREVFLVESIFRDRDESIGGEFIFIPDAGSIESLLAVFGV
ncbi:MAG: chemotaxis protein CheC [Candidatus Tyrphobacter sp.]